MITWIDLETTGLDPREGAIMEVGCVITDDDFIPVAEESWYGIEPIGGWPQLMDDYVRDMHTKSGLLEELKEYSDTWSHPRHFTPDKLQDFIQNHNAMKSPMGGSSVHFDRKWLEHKCGGLIVSEIFSYRNIDVSSLKEVLMRAHPWVVDEWRQDSGDHRPHRALDDIYNSIGELQFYLAAFKSGALK